MFTTSVVEIDADEGRGAARVGWDEFDPAESAESAPAFIGPRTACDCPWEDHHRISLDKPPF